MFLKHVTSSVYLMSSSTHTDHIGDIAISHIIIMHFLHFLSPFGLVVGIWTIRDSAEF